MPTPQDQFKQRLADVVRDLSTSGRKDREAMFLLGELAHRLTSKAGTESWSTLKAGLSAADYDGLLKSFERQGNALTREGRVKPAYAIQALANSLVARTQNKDPQIAQGEILLDRAINAAIAYYTAELRTLPKSN